VAGGLKLLCLQTRGVRLVLMEELAGPEGGGCLAEAGFGNVCLGGQAMSRTSTTPSWTTAGESGRVFDGDGACAGVGEGNIHDVRAWTFVLVGGEASRVCIVATGEGGFGFM
jgi:hypothetical protein